MRLQSVSDDTLFFVFYGMPGDLAQLAAAVILCVTILAFPLSKHGRVSLFLVAVMDSGGCSGGEGGVGV